MSQLMAAQAAALQRSIGGSVVGTSVLGVGVDIAHTPRVFRLYQRYGKRFLRRVYHDSEVAEFKRRMSRCENRGADYLASRWSAKEAAYKALGGGAAVAALRRHDHCSGYKVPSTPRLQFPELVVRSDAGGGVSVELLGGARMMARAAGVVGTHLSLSHEEEYAVAVVVALAPAVSTFCGEASPS